MLIKVFTKNSNGKIEITPDELKKILDEAYWEGYRSNTNTSLWTYNSPNIINKAAPYSITCDTAKATISTNNISNAIEAIKDSVGVSMNH